MAEREDWPKERLVGLREGLLRPPGLRFMRDGELRLGLRGARLGLY